MILSLNFIFLVILESFFFLYCKNVNGTIILFMQSTLCATEKNKLWRWVYKTENRKTNYITVLGNDFGEFVKHGGIEQLLELIFSSGILSYHFYDYYSNQEIKKIDNAIHRLDNFMLYLNTYADKLQIKLKFSTFWDACSKLISIFILVKNFKYICQFPSEKTEFCIHLNSKETKNAPFGSIVFINSDLSFSFHDIGNTISMGIINEKYIANNNQTSISIFGSSFVRVFIPKKYETIDKRGMFVIINIDEEKSDSNIGVGEIISFGDLLLRNSDSFQLVGYCAIDLIENSLFLYSCSEKKPIPFPIDKNLFTNENDVCFVTMISIPKNKALIEAILPILNIDTIKRIVCLTPTQTKLQESFFCTVEEKVYPFKFILEKIEKIYEKPCNIYQL